MRLFIILLLITNFAFAQIGQLKKSEYNFSPRFNVDVINSAAAQDGKTKVDIYFQFPYSSLQFVKENGRFTAGYTITIEAVNQDSDKIEITDVYDETVTADSYEASVSQRSMKISLRTLYLTPGNYEFKIYLEDKESSKQFATAVKKEVVSGNPNLFISDIILISNALYVDGREQLIPNISRLILDSQSNLSFYFDIHSDEAKTVRLTYKLVDSDNSRLFQIEEIQNLKPGKNTVVKTFTQLNLTLGNYKIQILENGLSDADAIREKEFHSIIRGFPASIVNLDIAIKQMKYIAKPEEMDALESDTLSYKQRMQLFVAFWKTKDPDPSTQLNEVLIEYYRRVEYANKHFKGYSEGWNTDMGFVYIIFGNPDSVDRNPFNSSNKPYEVWYYNNINRRFVFVDETGFGNYRLINNDFRDMTDFRY